MSLAQRRINVSLAILVLTLSACGGGVSAADATQTVAALATSVQGTVDALGREVGETAAPGADTPTPSQTPSPTLPPLTATITPTSTPSVPTAHVNENTHCRSGPGKIFDLRYTAMAGTDLVVVSLSTLTDYVVVEIPDKPGQLCWLWTRYAELYGDTSGLVMSTPPPTPTPTVDFSVVYDYMDGCVGWDPAFKVVNTGSVTFKSYHAKVYDTVGGMTQEHTGDNFDETHGCPILTAIPQLDPGMTGWAHAYSFPYNPIGNLMEGTIKLCTGPALSGTCITKSLTFTG
ncbi:MAG: hypothetical protein GTO14_11305 [Anaerolineales bacterium]|nr:hypothetical protein [Anaerolineales bacterium]